MTCIKKGVYYTVYDDKGYIVIRTSYKKIAIAIMNKITSNTN